MMELIKVKQAIIVEGKYDKIKLKSIIDGVIITTNGFGIYKDKEKLSLIRTFARKEGIIILTDSDTAGFQIRSHLKSCVKDGKIINVYIPDVFGKEKRKLKPSKQGKIGVEGISRDIILEAFQRAGITAEKAEEKKPDFLNKTRMIDLGFIGNVNSSEKRKNLQRALGLPELMSTKALIEVINCLYTEDEFSSALDTINKEET